MYFIKSFSVNSQHMNCEFQALCYSSKVAGCGSAENGGWALWGEARLAWVWGGGQECAGSVSGASLPACAGGVVSKTVRGE